MKKRLLGCLILALLVSPSTGQAQQKAYPHLQIFLVPTQPEERTSFIAFWDGNHGLQAGPFPLKLLERAGLNILLDISYSKANEELPSAARLKIQRRDRTSLQGKGGLALVDQPADLIADRGASKMFPDGPFLVIGHKAPSEGILQVGSIMGKIQGRLLACDKDYRRELQKAMSSLSGTSSYGHVLKTVESTYPPCPLQTP